MIDALIDALEFHESADRGGQERAIQTRRLIVAAAVPIFGAKGYEHASTHEIAAAADINQGLITYHFGSKEKLWQTVVDEVVGAFRNMLASELRAAVVWDQAQIFRRIVEVYVRWAADNPNLFRILIELNRTTNERSKWYAEQHVRPVFDVLTSIIIDGQERGLLRPGSPVGMYYQLISAGMVFMIPDEARWLSGVDVTSDEFVQSHAELLYQMFLNSDKDGENTHDRA